MADYGWRNDNRQWDDQRRRFQGGRSGSDYSSSNAGDDWRGQSRQDFGRESDYGAGYNTPQDFDDMNQRPGGMRDQSWSRDRDSSQQDWNQQGSRQDWNRQDWNRQDWNQDNNGNWRSRQGVVGRYGYGMRNSDYDQGSQRYGNQGYRGGQGYGGGQSFGAGGQGSSSHDYGDYGDWQEPGMGAYGGPRFGSNYPGNRDFYGRGYGSYGGGSYGGNTSRGYSSYGRDYGDDRWTNRNLWNRATDEVASWVGDDEAGRRREMDRMRNHAGRGPKGYTRSDDRIREDINDRLTDDWQLDASNLEVSVNNGEVTLTGTVDDIEDKHRAERIIENMSGVKHVQNNLRVDASSRSTSNTSTANPATSTPVGSTGAGTSYSSSSRPSTSTTQPGNGGTAH